MTVMVIIFVCGLVILDGVGSARTGENMKQTALRYLLSFLLVIVIAYSHEEFFSKLGLIVMMCGTTITLFMISHTITEKWLNNSSINQETGKAKCSNSFFP